MERLLIITKFVKETICEVNETKETNLWNFYYTSRLELAFFIRSDYRIWLKFDSASPLWELWYYLYRKIGRCSFLLINIWLLTLLITSQLHLNKTSSSFNYRNNCKTAYYNILFNRKFWDSVIHIPHCYWLKCHL